jgi:hypothetical protein
MCTKFQSENLNGRHHLRDLGDNIKMVLNSTGRELDSYDSEQYPVAGCCEHGDEDFCPMKGGTLLGQLNDHQLLHKDSPP